ncbi:PDZ domain-containing protein [bacterium]|nr:PDZ domain-containing protein [bacterium]
MNQGYYSQPTISSSKIAFISDDDLWVVGRKGGTAQRLTANKGMITSPCFSPDGKYIAYISTDTAVEGDLYIISSEGGEARRLTWLGVNRVVAWKDNKTIYFTSGIEAYPRREAHVYELDVATQDFKKINLGPSSFYHKGNGYQVLARNSGDSARWKRYQGGTAGVLWTQQGAGKFQRILKNIKTNITRPEIINKQIYFISDHEGVANIYTCDLNGQKIKRLTDHIEYYCRNLRSCEDTLVYQCGAEIHTLDLNSGKSEPVEISCATTAMQSIARYEPWAKYFHGADVHPNASELAIISRGHLFQAPPFSGAVKELDTDKNIRYSHPSYNFDGSKLLVAGAHGESSEALFVFDTKAGTKKQIFAQVNWGKIWGIKFSPKVDLAAVITNKKEVYLLDLKKNTSKKIEVNEFNRPADLDWSPDGRYLVYTSSVDSRRAGIRIYDTEKSQLRFLLNPVSSDYSPSFDPEGKYLYFLSIRDFAPNYNETHFDLGFPFATRPYVVALESKTQSPFEAPFENPKAEEKSKEKDSKKKNGKKSELKVEIEFEGIENRIQAFNLPLGGYAKLAGVKGGILYWKADVEPIENHDRFFATPGITLHQYKFEEACDDVFQKGVENFYLNSAKNHVLMFANSKLRLVETKAKPSDEAKVGKKDGYVDGSRLKLKIEPKLEWQQMYHEAWILQKEHFWRQDLSKIDWNLIYKRYQKLLLKVKTRLEFSDLMWEMQGELGTSHCYEMMGNYNRFGAGIQFARLGAYFTYDAKTKSYRIDRILKGDAWSAVADSPLTAMGVSLKEQDQIFAIDGVSFNRASDLYELLENKAAQKIELTILRKGSKTKEKVTVKSNRTLSAAWYREWVEKNKKYVHEMSGGKLGYVHIPDMGSNGYAEFYRHFVSESRFEGIVVDVRYNGGGHVSQHLLKVLAQKAIGFDETRHQGVERYPTYAPGVLVALANEHSGSDGDIFPHSFKLMKLGKLIGKRTWGGVIGINGQYSLRDGTYVTQPEYSFWFKDNEWFVENHGVDPDIEVEITPEDYRDKKDPQLERGVKEALAELKKNPNTKFKPTYYPDLSIPKKLAKLNR